MGIEFDDWAPNCHWKNIGRLEFKGLSMHTYVCEYENLILADFNLVVTKVDS